MSINDLRFVPQVRYFVQCGKIPLILIGSHSYSIEQDGYESEFDGKISSEIEKEEHYCDFLVNPILTELRKKDLFYVIENLTSRSIVDMNRSNSRQNDSDDSNDILFRQTIRYMCDYVKRIHQKMPILIDIHSFSEYNKWGDYDIVILEQTKIGMKSNKSLIEFTKNYFNDQGWEIIDSKIHNQDDIVEEIAYKKLGIPLLIEFNEKIKENDFESLITSIENYLIEINKKNQINLDLAQYSFDHNLLPSFIGKYEIENQLKNIDQILFQDDELKQLYKTYLELSLKKITLNTAIVKYNTDSSGYPTLYDLNNNIEENRSETENIINTLYTLSNQNSTIIIPLELYSNWIKFHYSEINRQIFEEWGIQVELLIEAFLEESFQNQLGLIVPRFAYPFSANDYIYENYFVNSRYYISYGILINNIKNLENSVENDFAILSKYLSIKELTDCSLDLEEKVKLLKKSVKQKIF